MTPFQAKSKIKPCVDQEDKKKERERNGNKE